MHPDETTNFKIFKNVSDLSEKSETDPQVKDAQITKRLVMSYNIYIGFYTIMLIWVGEVVFQEKKTQLYLALIFAYCSFIACYLFLIKHMVKFNQKVENSILLITITWNIDILFSVYNLFLITIVHIVIYQHNLALIPLNFEMYLAISFLL